MSRATHEPREKAGSVALAGQRAPWPCGPPSPSVRSRRLWGAVGRGAGKQGRDRSVHAA